MLGEWIWALLWIWAGGTLPIMAGGALADAEEFDKPGLALFVAFVALLWPAFVGWAIWDSTNNN